MSLLHRVFNKEYDTQRVCMVDKLLEEFYKNPRRFRLVSGDDNYSTLFDIQTRITYCVGLHRMTRVDDIVILGCPLEDILTSEEKLKLYTEISKYYSKRKVKLVNIKRERFLRDFTKTPCFKK